MAENNAPKGTTTPNKLVNSESLSTRKLVKIRDFLRLTTHIEKQITHILSKDAFRISYRRLFNNSKYLEMSFFV